MTVTERPLFGRLELERWNDPSIKHPAQGVYSESFESSVGGWVAGTGTSVFNVTATGHSGARVLSTQRSATSGVATASRTITGLTIGKLSTASVWLLNTSDQAAISATISVTGRGSSAAVSPSAASGWVQLSVDFTPTATSHVVVFSATQSPAPIYWDDVAVTQKAWTEVIPGYWVPYIADATRCSVRRGGSRSGLGIKTDVGLMSFTLHNAQDPLNGGAFKSGQTVRATVRDIVVHPEVGHFEPGPDIITGYQPVVTVPAADVYSYGFESYAETTTPALGVFTFGYETTADPAWTGVAIGRNDMSTTGNKGHTGNFALFMNEAVGAWKTASYVRTGLEVGRSYTFEAWVAGSNGTSYQARLGFDGNVGTAVNLTGSYATSAGYQKLSIVFTATSTSHTLTLGSIRNSGSTNFTSWDDISLTRNAYTTVTNNGADGWTLNEGLGDLAVPVTGSAAHSGSRSVQITNGGNLKRTIAGLDSDHSYSLAFWHSADGVTWSRATVSPFINESGQVNSGYVDPGYLDDITLTRNAYTTGGEPIYGPGPDVWVVDEEEWTEVLKTTPIFTGTVSDIKACYPLDKNTGKKRVSVTVEVADAVKTHSTTPRYGAFIGAPYYETFEQRITRYSGTALAPIEPPPVGSPKVVYSF